MIKWRVKTMVSTCGRFQVDDLGEYALAWEKAKEEDGSHRYNYLRGPTGRSDFPSVTEALSRCEVRARELDEGVARCECGCALAHFTGAGATGVLCPRCDHEHASELLEVMP